MKQMFVHIQSGGTSRIIISLLLSFFFIFLGTDSITTIIRHPAFITDLVVVLLLTFILLTWVSVICRYLDVEFSWHAKFKQRLLRQSFFGIFVPAAFTGIYMYFYFFGVMKYSWSEVGFFYNEFPISIIVIAAVNLFYTAGYFFLYSKKQNEELHALQQLVYTLQFQSGVQAIPSLQEHLAPAVVRNEEEEVSEAFSPAQKIKLLVAVSGNKNIPIPVEQIAYITKENNFAKLITFANDSYLLNHSLDDLMKLLDEQLFFRANRQFIISLKSCHYFTNEENGKLELHLLPQTDDEIIISQKRSAQFKEWLSN